MSLFYRLLYRVGFTPWEGMARQPAIGEQIAAMFAGEEVGPPPHGRALDLGCGSGIHAVTLARRGWEVTGVDLVPQALARARSRARRAKVEVRLLRGDVTDLRAAGVEGPFRLVLDFGTGHGLDAPRRRAMGSEVTAVTSAGAALLVLAFAPGERGPLPGGLSRRDVEAMYSEWEIAEVVPQAGRLPRLLSSIDADPRWFRLRRR